VIVPPAFSSTNEQDYRDIVSTPQGEQMTGTPRALRRLAIGAVAGLGLVLSGCAKNAPQDTFRPAGTAAKTIDKLRWVYYAAGIVGIIVAVAVIIAVVKFRDKPGRVIPPQSHGNRGIEIGLTACSAALLLAVAVPTTSTILKLAKQPPKDALTVNVIGQQWWWEYQYIGLKTADGSTVVITSGELVMPVGQKVKLNITSRDVIHSFWIPRLNGKKDAVPGRIHPLWMEADQPGLYDGQCTEFCGLSHANMRMAVAALNDADWKQWVAGQTQPSAKPATGSPAAAGYATFSRCTSCHQVNGYTDADGKQIIAQPSDQLVSGAAPNLTHLMSRSTFAGGSFPLMTEACRQALLDAKPADFGQLYLKGSADCLNRPQLERWLRDPAAMKPMAPDPNKYGLRRGMPNLGLSEQQIDDLIAYLTTLK